LIAFNVFVELVVALTTAVSMGFLHELLHIYMARHLGYNVKKIDFFKNEIIVDVDDIDDIRKIARAPYIVLIPLNMIIFLTGIWFCSIGLIVGSLTVLLLHAVSYRREGIKIDEKQA